MGNSQSRRNNTPPKNVLWYEYSSSKCVSNGSGSLRCVTVRGDKNSNAGRGNAGNNSRNLNNKKTNNKKTTNNNNNKKKTTTNNRRRTKKNKEENRTMGLRKHGRRGLLGSVW